MNKTLTPYTKKIKSFLRKFRGTNQSRKKKKKLSRIWYRNNMASLLAVVFFCMAVILILVSNGKSLESNNGSSKALAEQTNESGDDNKEGQDESEASSGEAQAEASQDGQAADSAQAVPVTEVQEPFVHKRTLVETKKILSEFAENNGLIINQYSEPLVELLMNHYEAKDFVLYYPLRYKKEEGDYKKYEHYTETEIDNVINAKNQDALPALPYELEDDYKTKIPNYYQWDERWCYKEYGSDAFGLTGCGPTCLSMVSSYLMKKKNMTPSWMADFSMIKGYAIPGHGTSWELMNEGAQELGLTVEEIVPNETYMVEALKEGKPLICIMGEGHFTNDGHFIVFKDYEGEKNADGLYEGGKFIINDPNCIENSEKKWSYSEFETEIGNIWAYSYTNVNTNTSGGLKNGHN